MFETGLKHDDYLEPPWPCSILRKEVYLECIIKFGTGMALATVGRELKYARQ